MNTVIPYHIRPRPKHYIDFDDLYTTDEKKSSRGLRILKDPYSTESRPSFQQFTIYYNKWSLDNMFKIGGQSYLVPTFLGNNDAWMLEWEIARDAYREPTKGWLGKYYVWYTNPTEGAFYMFKQNRAEFGEGGVAVYAKKMPAPGKDDNWFDKEVEMIWRTMCDLRMPAIKN